MMPEILFIHIVSASFALLGGYAALFARKGSKLHRRAGTLFVWAMIVMGFGASILARAQGGGGLSGFMISYLVISAVASVRDPATVPRWLHPGLMVTGLALGIIVTLASLIQVNVVTADPPSRGGVIYGGILLLAGLGDLRIHLRGPLRGSARIRRHVWRMCFAMFNATGSFFLGQADEIPERLRIWPMLFLLAFLPLIVMLYYVLRRSRDRASLVRPPSTRAAGYQLR